MKTEMTNFKAEYNSIRQGIEKRLKKVLSSGWYVLGREVESFESEFAEYIGVKYAVGVNSGTDAILIALMSLGIGPGDEVITVSHTTIPTVMPILLLGAKPVFVDVTLDGYTMDPDQVQEKITRKTKAILPVHLYGNPADMRPLMKIAKKNNIPIIEDACQAHGAEYMGKKVGSFGVCAAFSFYPTKNLGTYGDGGILVTDNNKLYKTMKQTRQYGWVKRYDSRRIGVNSRLDEIHAAILREKLKRLDKWNQARRKVAASYINLITNAKIDLPKTDTFKKHVYHQFVIRVKNRKKIVKILANAGVQTMIHYPVPVHKQIVCKQFNSKNLNVTENISKEILSLPINPFIKNETVKFIAGIINEASR